MARAIVESIVDRLPDNDVLVISGGAELASVVALIARAYGSGEREFDDLVDRMLPVDEATTRGAALQAQLNAQARKDLFDEFGVLTSAEVADVAGSTAQNRAALANQWLRAGRVLAVQRGRTLLFPGFQFDADGRPRPAVAAALKVLRSAQLGPWSAALWFTTASEWLDGLRPVDLLDDPEAVRQAAIATFSEAVT